MKKLRNSLLMFLFCFSVQAMDCDKHPIYCQIKKNKPSLDNKYAMKVSNIVYKMHRKYHIPTRIFTAILNQESGYSLKAKGCHKGMMGNVEARICSDFGIAQIYYRTAQRYKMDLPKLTTDLEYSIEAGAIVLADFMNRYEAKDAEWYLRYNCGSRGTTKRDTCQIYKKLVERYL